MTTLVSCELDRIATLRQLLEHDPKSSFARYGLAMELIKSGQLADAVVEFRVVLAHDPTYASAYYHGGQTLEKLGDIEGAKEMYRAGLSNVRDPHALGEMRAALDILG